MFEKVLSTPIRPQFAIVYVGPNFYPEAHTLVRQFFNVSILPYKSFIGNQNFSRKYYI